MARMSLDQREQWTSGGAVDGVGGAATQLQPLSVEQERHHVEKVHEEQGE